MLHPDFWDDGPVWVWFFCSTILADVRIKHWKERWKSCFRMDVWSDYLEPSIQQPEVPDVTAHGNQLQWGFPGNKRIKLVKLARTGCPTNCRNWWSCSLVPASADTSMTSCASGWEMIGWACWIALFVVECCCGLLRMSWGLVAADSSLKSAPELKTNLFQGDLAWSVLGPGICCSRDEPCPDMPQNETCSLSKLSSVAPITQHWFLTS